MANFLLRSDWRVEEAGTVKLPVESSIRLLLFAVGDEVERSDYVSATNARRVEDKKSLAQVQHDYAGVTCERADELGQRKDRSCAGNNYRIGSAPQCSNRSILKKKVFVTSGARAS